jgi:hypothetical protein
MPIGKSNNVKSYRNDRNGMEDNSGPERVLWRWTAEDKIKRLSSEISRWSNAVEAREANKPDCPRLPQGKEIMAQLEAELSYWRTEYLKCWYSEHKPN